jgi:hypothetical protein
MPFKKPPDKSPIDLRPRWEVWRKAIRAFQTVAVVNERKSTIQFDPTEHYILSEAFFRCGRLLFPSSWTGREQFAQPDHEFATTRELRKSLEAAQERLFDQQIAMTRLETTGMDQGTYSIHAKAIETLRQRGLNARLARNRIDDTFATIEADQKTFERRHATEARLCEALAKKELQLICGGSWVVDWRNWTRHRDFKLHFPTSVLIAPRDVSSRRRNVVYIAKKPFDLWIDKSLTIEQSVIKREGEDAFQAMKKWFISWIEANSRPVKKPETEVAFRQAFFPKKAVSFTELWALLTPKEWQDHGRRKDKK